MSSCHAEDAAGVRLGIHVGGTLDFDSVGLGPAYPGHHVESWRARAGSVTWVVDAKAAERAVDLISESGTQSLREQP